jgi:hypothetical protein
MRTISLKNHQNEHIIQASEHSQITNVSRNTQEDVVRILHSGEQARNTLEIEQYRAMIVAQIEELKAIRLEEIDGKFYFHNMKGIVFWPIVNKKIIDEFSKLCIQSSISHRQCPRNYPKTKTTCQAFSYS